MKPFRYFQILTPDTEGVLRPLEVHQFDASEEGVFTTKREAKEFIEDHFDNDQSPELVPPEEKDMTLIIMPIYLVRFKAKG